MDTPITIPVSQITGFTTPPGLRYGQAIHQKLQLEKITSVDGKVWRKSRPSAAPGRRFFLSSFMKHSVN